MRLMNDVCSLKIGWRMLQERDVLWSKVLISKYGINVSIEANLKVQPTDSPLWRNLGKLWPKLFANCAWSIKMVEVLGSGKMIGLEEVESS